MKLLVHNHTTLSIDNKLDQLFVCLQTMFDGAALDLLSFTCEDFGYRTPNFTTAGIYLVHGFVEISKEQLPWSIILKVIKADSREKEDVQHHNYWRREALVMESKLLDNLPESIHAAKSYLVEEQQDGTIWLWMEFVDGNYAYSQEQFNFIARQLGRFNGTYLMGKALPNPDWICRGWLKSWTTASRMYAPNPEDYLNHLQKDNEHSIWGWYQGFSNQIEDHLSSLESLPRVIAHQDLSQMNMLLVTKDRKLASLVLIDWQFMSISGIGEDLGKLFGVNMSLGIIPPDEFEAYQVSLFNSYILGLKDTGWEGDEQLAWFGYCLSTALRSEWEVHQFFSLFAQLQSDPLNITLQHSVYRLEKIIKIHMKMALEAHRSSSTTNFEHVGGTIMTEQTIAERLNMLGITLPSASDPAAKYANYVKVNNLLFVSGKGPAGSPKGKLGDDFTTEEGYQFARQAGIEVLAVLESALGSLDKVKRVIKIQGFVNATATFEEHHKVLNGCSDLMLDVFGENGLHARSVLGAVSVRDNLPIIIDSIFEVEE